MNLVIIVLLILSLTFIVMCAVVMGCIVFAFRNGEDVDSDEVRDKYVELSMCITLTVLFIIWIAYKIGFQ